MTATVERALQAPASVSAETEQRRTLAIAAAGTLLALCVYTIPLALMPSIAAGTGAGSGAQTWLLAAVSLGMATTLMCAGALGDDYGRKRVLIGGAYVLAVASVICALAPNPGVFLIGALAQGVGGAAILACSLGLIAHAFPEGPARGRATGVWSAALGAGIGLGPLVAAALEPVGGWQAAFAVSCFFSLVLAAFAHALLVESRAADHNPIDLAGMLLLGAGLGALIGGLVRGRSGWVDPPTLTLLGAAAVLLAAFTVVEARQQAPMLDLSLFRSPRFVAVTVAAVGTGLGVIAALSYLPTMAQRGLGDSPIVGAALVAVWAAASVATALTVPARLPEFTGRQHLAGGLLVVSLGLVTLWGVDTSTNPLTLVAGLALAGLGSGVANAALGREAVASVPHGRGSLGSGANQTARYVASSIGVSIVATIVAAQGTGAQAVIDGWNIAILVTAALSLLGAVAVLACRPHA